VAESSVADVENYRHLYRCAVDYLDRAFARFVDEVRHDSRLETTVVIISDHGENLGYPSDEHLIGHNSMSNAILHTPLEIVNPPEGFPDRITEPVSHLSLGELIQTIAYEKRFPDHVRQETVPAEAPRVGGLRRSEEPAAPHIERLVRCLVRHDQRTEWDSLGRCAEFEIQRGFPEVETKTGECRSPPDEAEEFFERALDEYKTELDIPIPDAMDIDETTEQRLEDLGYL
jgi:hypothetical protein